MWEGGFILYTGFGLKADDEMMVSVLDWSLWIRVNV